jgi:hypothetical protein
MNMEISFTVDTSELRRAIGVVSIVTPQATSQGGGGGYLFSVQGQECTLYSRDSTKHEARSSFPISNVEGEGQFMFPAEYAARFGYIKASSISFKATETNGAFKVGYSFGTSGKEDLVSFDPREMYNFERDIKAAQDTIQPKEFSIPVLQFAIGTTEPFLPKKTDSVDQEFYKTIKVFGNDDPELAQKANGYMISSNNKEICYFHCPAFIDCGLTLPQLHLGMFKAFLGRSTGNVHIYTTDKKSYVLNSQGDVFGWPKHSSEYSKFMYYSAKSDEVVVLVNPEDMVNELKFIRSPQKDKVKARMHFDPSDLSFHFSSADENNTNKSEPVSTEKVEVRVTSPLSINVNVDHMIDMFQGIQGDKVGFHIKVIPADDKRPRDRFMLRTIDTFCLGNDGTVGGIGAKLEGEAHQCKVTRYAPSID